MWTVHGEVKGRPYSLTWADGGIVDAPDFLLQHLALYEGRSVGITPTGPFVALAPADEDAVFAGLAAFTHVEDVEGDSPSERWPELPDGAIG
jgi:hypothetical protein